jgi:hypothetical protein
MTRSCHGLGPDGDVRRGLGDECALALLLPPDPGVIDEFDQCENDRRAGLGWRVDLSVGALLRDR